MSFMGGQGWGSGIEGAAKRAAAAAAGGAAYHTAMGWFEKLCRRSGLMIHHVADATKKPVSRTERREIGREVDEREAEPGVTLRRTTIDEIELREPPRER